MDVKKIQGKLQKLLALSASPNEAEAALAMAKCSELMEKYGIRTIDVNEETNEVGIATARVPGQTKHHRVWESKLAGCIAGCFDAECVLESNGTGWNVMFITTISEQDIIIDLYKRLRRTISFMGKEYARTHKGNAAKLQKAYAYGMIVTIKGRLNTIYTEMAKTTALVVVKEQAIANKLEDLFGKDIGKHKGSPARDKGAYMQGMEDGENVNLNKSLGGSAQNQVRA